MLTLKQMPTTTHLTPRSFSAHHLQQQQQQQQQQQHAQQQQQSHHLQLQQQRQQRHQLQLQQQRQRHHLQLQQRHHVQHVQHVQHVHHHQDAQDFPPHDVLDANMATPRRPRVNGVDHQSGQSGFMVSPLEMSTLSSFSNSPTSALMAVSKVNSAKSEQVVGKKNLVHALTPTNSNSPTLTPGTVSWSSVGGGSSTPRSRSMRELTLKRKENAPVSLEGWLLKQGSDGLMLWKRRWFVLSDYCLFYYKGPSESKALGSILLPSYVISPAAEEKRRFAFKAQHQNMRTYVFAADSKDAMLRWMNALSLASILQDANTVHPTLSTTPSLSHSTPMRHHQHPTTVVRQMESPLNGNAFHPDLHKHALSDMSKLMSSHILQPLYANAPPKPRRLPSSSSHGGAAESPTPTPPPPPPPTRPPRTDTLLMQHSQPRRYTLQHATRVQNLQQSHHPVHYRHDRATEEVEHGRLQELYDSQSSRRNGDSRCSYNPQSPMDAFRMLRGQEQDEGVDQQLPWPHFRPPPTHKLPPFVSDSKASDLYPERSAPRMRHFPPPPPPEVARPLSADFLHHEEDEEDIELEERFLHHQQHQLEEEEVRAGRAGHRVLTNRHHKKMAPRPKSSVDPRLFTDTFWSNDKEIVATKERTRGTMPRSNTSTTDSQMDSSEEVSRYLSNPSSVSRAAQTTTAAARQVARPRAETATPSRMKPFTETEDNGHCSDLGTGDFRRSSSARLSRNRRNLVGDLGKREQREESMKRLQEWKQRMLASPLTRKSSRNASRTQTPTGSSNSPAPSLHNNDRQRVLNELEKHDLRPRIDQNRRQLVARRNSGKMGNGASNRSRSSPRIYNNTTSSSDEGLRGGAVYSNLEDEEADAIHEYRERLKTLQNRAFATTSSTRSPTRTTTTSSTRTTTTSTRSGTTLIAPDDCYDVDREADVHLRRLVEDDVVFRSIYRHMLDKAEHKEVENNKSSNEANNESSTNESNDVYVVSDRPEREMSLGEAMGLKDTDAFSLSDINAALDHELDRKVEHEAISKQQTTTTTTTTTTSTSATTTTTSAPTPRHVSEMLSALEHGFPSESVDRKKDGERMVCSDTETMLYNESAAPSDCSDSSSSDKTSKMDTSTSYLTMAEVKAEVSPKYLSMQPVAPSSSMVLVHTRSPSQTLVLDHLRHQSDSNYVAMYDQLDLARSKESPRYCEIDEPEFKLATASSSESKETNLLSMDNRSYYECLWSSEKTRSSKIDEAVYQEISEEMATSTLPDVLSQTSNTTTTLDMDDDERRLRDAMLQRVMHMRKEQLERFSNSDSFKPASFFLKNEKDLDNETNFTQTKVDEEELRRSMSSLDSRSTRQSTNPSLVSSTDLRQTSLVASNKVPYYVSDLEKKKKKNLDNNNDDDDDDDDEVWKASLRRASMEHQRKAGRRSKQINESQPDVQLLLKQEEDVDKEDFKEDFKEDIKENIKEEFKEDIKDAPRDTADDQDDRVVLALRDQTQDVSDILRSNRTAQRRRTSSASRKDSMKNKPRPNLVEISAQDLLGKSHEELVLILIHLRRQSNSLNEAIEKSKSELASLATDRSPKVLNSHLMADLESHVVELEEQRARCRPIISLVDNMVKLGSLYCGPQEAPLSHRIRNVPRHNADNHRPNDKPVTDARIQPRDDDEQERRADIQLKLLELYHIETALAEERVVVHSLLKAKTLVEERQRQSVQHEREQTLSKENVRLQQQLEASEKRLEDNASEHCRWEHDVLFLRQQLQSCASRDMQFGLGKSAETLAIENELAQVQQEASEVHQVRHNLIEAIHERRQDVEELSLGDIGQADERVQRFFGIIPKNNVVSNNESNNKTVRMVKRDSKERLLKADTKEGVEEVRTEPRSEAPPPLPRGNYQNMHDFLDAKNGPTLNSMTSGNSTSAPPPPPPPPSSSRTSATSTTRVSSASSDFYKRLSHAGSTTSSVTSGLSAHERLFGSSRDNSTSPPESPAKSPIFKSDTAKAIMEEVGKSNKGNPKRRANGKRQQRSHTITTGNPAIMEALQEHQAKQNASRSRDDLDMAQALRPKGPSAPDVIKSALDTSILKEGKMSPKAIDTIFGVPEKIVIPERYVPDLENDEVTPEERQVRLKKADSIRRMLAGSNVGTTRSDGSGSSDEPREVRGEDRQQREHLLALNQALAREVMQKSRIVAVEAMARLQRASEVEDDEEDELHVDDHPLPLIQQRDNLLS